MITYHPPGSVYTATSQIDPQGTIIGWYLDTTGVVHGFWRNARRHLHLVRRAGRGHSGAPKNLPV